ncbi:MAG: amidase [Anaerolineales bacterium]|nr:MAG: amidase [Anaerolineales bacterium]
MSSFSVYDLKSVKLPRLAGGVLNLIVNLVENPLTRGLILGNLLQNGGIIDFGKLEVLTAPTFQPNPPRHFQQDDQDSESLDVLQTIQDQYPFPNQQAGFKFNTIQDYAHAYREGRTTPVQVAEAALAAIADSEQHNPALHVFIAMKADDVLEQAQAATQRIQQGTSLGILDGVPVAIKDELDMIPFPTTIGTRFLGHSPVAADATVVARLRAAGALLLGKTNMHEIGIGVTGHNTHYGTVRNPYNPGHHTGGSSSGPAAAVAAGFCPLAVGADGGGSIRIPSGFCGVVGLKPTFSRISEHGAASLTWSMGHLGPIAATPHDAAVGYAIMAGADPHDLNTLNQPPISLRDLHRLELSDLTLGVYWPWFRHADAQVVYACEEMLDRLEKLGASIREVELPELEAARLAHVITIGSEIAAALEPYYATHHKDYSLEVRINLALARSLTSRDYLKAQQVRTRTIAYFETALSQVHAILTPATAVTAPPINLAAQPDGESDLTVLTEIMRYATPPNLTGYPAISFPAGYDQAGLPIGMQAIAGYWQEHLLLRLAHAAQQELERKAPAVHYHLFAD